MMEVRIFRLLLSNDGGKGFFLISNWDSKLFFFIRIFKKYWLNENCSSLLIAF